MPSANLNRWKEKGSFYAYDSTEAFYRDEGKGKNLLLIHGFPTSSFDWVKIWPALTKQFRVIAPDLIGYGFSGKPKDFPYTAFTQADMIEGLVRSLGIKELIILAHDYGDTITQELLARQEDKKLSFRIRSVCFLNGGIFPETHKPRLIQKLLLSPIGPLMSLLINENKFRVSFSEVFGKQSQPTIEELVDFWYLITYNNGLRNYHKLIRYITERKQNRERWVKPLMLGKIPMRLINGPEDPVSGIHMVDTYKNLVPNADVVVLPTVGHYPQVEAPKKVEKAFLEFLKSL